MKYCCIMKGKVCEGCNYCRNADNVSVSTDGDKKTDWNQFDIQKFYDTLAKIIGDRENVTIKFTIERKEDK